MEIKLSQPDRTRPYLKARFVYPPRPEYPVPPTELDGLTGDRFMAQAKLDGSCCVVVLDGSGAEVWNRHKERFAKPPTVDLASLHRGNGLMVLVGEFMNKSKKDETGRKLEGFVIHDLLAYDGVHLVGSTFAERWAIIERLYPGEDRGPALVRIAEGLYRVKAVTEGFGRFYETLTRYDAYEGVVLKRHDGRLDAGLSEKSCSTIQLKCRRSTKNYRH